MNEVDAALMQLLTSDATCMSLATEVCNTVGTEDTVFPFYVFIKQPRGDEDRYSFATRVGKRLEYAVKAVTLGPSREFAQQMADAADAVLLDSAPSLAGWSWQYCRRRGSIDYQVVAPDGTLEQHVGGVYDIFVAKE